MVQLNRATIIAAAAGLFVAGVLVGGIGVRAIAPAPMKSVAAVNQHQLDSLRLALTRQSSAIRTGTALENYTTGVASIDTETRILTAGSLSPRQQKMLRIASDASDEVASYWRQLLGDQISRSVYNSFVAHGLLQAKTAKQAADLEYETSIQLLGRLGLNPELARSAEQNRIDMRRAVLSILLQQVDRKIGDALASIDAVGST